MNRAVQIARLAAYGSLAVLLAALAIATLRITPVVRQSSENFNHLLVDADDMVKRANLTLKESDYLILKAGLTADSAKKASDKELVMLDEWNRQITSTLGDVDQSVRGANATMSSIALHSASTLDETGATIADLQPTLNAARQTLNAATETLSDPDIAKTIANFQITSNNAAIISTDARIVVEKYAHPTKKKLGFWGSIWAAAQVVHHISPPLF